MSTSVNYQDSKKIEISGAEKAANISSQGILIQARIKALEEESRELMQDTIRCELRFAKQDLEAGLSFDEVANGIKERYSKRFYEPIIEAMKKAFRR